MTVRLDPFQNIVNLGSEQRDLIVGGNTYMMEGSPNNYEVTANYPFFGRSKNGKEWEMIAQYKLGNKRYPYIHDDLIPMWMAANGYAAGKVQLGYYYGYTSPYENGELFRSVDEGLTWEATGLSPPSDSSTCGQIIYGKLKNAPKKFYAIFYRRIAPYNVTYMSSEDGFIWNNMTKPFDDSSVHNFQFAGEYLYAFGFNSQSEAVLARTDDGINWSSAGTLTNQNSFDHRTGATAIAYMPAWTDYEGRVVVPAKYVAIYGVAGDSYYVPMFGPYRTRSCCRISYDGVNWGSETWMAISVGWGAIGVQKIPGEGKAVHYRFVVGGHWYLNNPPDVIAGYLEPWPQPISFSGAWGRIGYSLDGVYWEYEAPIGFEGDDDYIHMHPPGGVEYTAHYNSSNFGYFRVINNSVVSWVVPYHEDSGQWGVPGSGRLRTFYKDGDGPLVESANPFPSIFQTTGKIFIRGKQN